MKISQASAIAAAAALLALPAALLAQDREQTQDQTRQTLRDRDIYGYRMMTPQERNEYRQRMQQARTVEERERIRAEHHERMKERAKERGITLPDQPPAGRGPAMGGGMGAGAGRGR